MEVAEEEAVREEEEAESMEEEEEEEPTEDTELVRLRGRSFEEEGERSPP